MTNQNCKNQGNRAGKKSYRGRKQNLTGRCAPKLISLRSPRSLRPTNLDWVHHRWNFSICILSWLITAANLRLCEASSFAPAIETIMWWTVPFSDLVYQGPFEIAPYIAEESTIKLRTSSYHPSRIRTTHYDRNSCLGSLGYQFQHHLDTWRKKEEEEEEEAFRASDDSFSQNLSLELGVLEIYFEGEFARKSTPIERRRQRSHPSMKPV